MNHADTLSLASVIGQLHPLPSPRGAALELLRLSRIENASVGDIAHVVQADPVLACKLIHAANSAARGGASQIASVSAAVMQLGFTATRQISLGFSLVNEYRQGACQHFDYKDFWTASLVRGLAAQAIAQRLGTGDPQEALACGLLTDIGRLALATSRKAAYSALLAEYGKRGARLRAAERECFGIDHGALGSAMLSIWNMPRRMSAAIEGYFLPPINANGVDRHIRRMSWTLVLAEAVVHASAAPDGQQDAWMHLAIDAAAHLDADADLLDAVTKEVALQVPSWAPLLDLPAPQLSSPDFPGYVQSNSVMNEDRIRLHILLVEDNESDRALNKMTLEKDGHYVRVAADGEEALEAIAEFQPQVVITDIDMPQMNGLDFCRTLRASRLGAHMFIIVFTGREKHEDLVECIHAGANDFVAKSANPMALLARVQAAARTVRSNDELMQSADVARNLATVLAVERGKALQPAH